MTALSQIVWRRLEIFAYPPRLPPSAHIQVSLSRFNYRWPRCEAPPPGEGRGGEGLRPRPRWDLRRRGAAPGPSGSGWGPRRGCGAPPAVPARGREPGRRLALAQGAQAPRRHLQGRGVEGDEEEAEPLFGRRQGAVWVHGKWTGGAGGPIAAPRGHRRWERRLKGRAPGLNLLAGQARASQAHRGAGLPVRAPDTGQTWCLLSWEAPYTINRDKLTWSAAPHLPARGPPRVTLTPRGGH